MVTATARVPRTVDQSLDRAFVSQEAVAALS
jgi:hypothetical protein